MSTSEIAAKKLKFNNQDKPGFYAELRKEVDRYFIDNGISKNANTSMVLKTIFFLSSLVLLYFLIILEIYEASITLVFASLIGMVQAFIGFNVSHDAIHGSYTKSKKLNKLIGYTFNLIGANAYVWEITHNQVHHTYTNIPGHDEDLDVAPGLVRLSPQDEHKEYMRFQHIYAFFLYCLSSLSWVFRKDYKKFFQTKVGQQDNRNHPMKEYYILFGFKLVYYGLFIVLPLVVMDITWWQFLVGFLVMHLSEGLVLASIFQLAHTVEDTEFPSPDQNWQMEESWARVQMIGTANFSIKNPIITFFTGGLNYQIEHHLFPLVCHIHYPALSPIVERVASKHGIPYNGENSFFGALKSHYIVLKELGKP